MAGSFITVRAYGSGEINALLSRIARAGTDLEPAFAEIGEYLIEATQERFKLELAPNGEQWEPLAPETLARKGQFKAFKHKKFWYSIDTKRDKENLEILIKNKKIPWSNFNN